MSDTIYFCLKFQEKQNNPQKYVKTYISLSITQHRHIK